MDFNKKKFVELLKESKQLRLKGKHLLDVNQAKFRELTHYFSLIEDDIFWQNRNSYLEIVKLYTNKNMTTKTFSQKFGKQLSSDNNKYDIRRKELESKAFDNLSKASEIDFQLHAESVGFRKIISNMNHYRDLIDPDIDLNYNLDNLSSLGYGISEEFMKELCKRYFLPELQKYCKKI